MADVPEQLGFYERMLPQRERPMDALGGILNGLGAGLRHPRPDLVAALPRRHGHRPGRRSASCSRASAGSRAASPWGFAIAALGWLIGMMLGVSRSPAAQSLMAVAEQAAAWDVFEQFERDVCQLGRVGGLLDWDEQVNMPPRGASARGAAKATLAGVLHERICDERFGEAIAELGGDGELGDVRARARARGAARARPRRARPGRARARARAGRVGGLRGLAGRARRAPTSRSSAIRSSASSRCGARRPTPSATRAASATTRCSTSTSPTCASRASSRCCTGCATSSCRSRRRSPRGRGPTTRSCTARTRAQIQRAVGARLAAAIGFDFEAGRLDEAAHPFASGFAPGDVRLTTREHEDDLFSGLFAVLHEAGHGLYEQGLTGAIEGTFCGHATSLGLHESQSRFWENMVGRSQRVLGAPPGRGPGGVPRAARPASRSTQFVRAANLVEPSLIRVEADEVTYHLHVFLRFELELALLRGDLARRRSAGGLERAHAHARRHRGAERRASACCRTCTGRPASSATSRPTRSARSTRRSSSTAIERELGPIDAIVRAGEYDRLLGWMREHVHARGALVAPEQIARDATGEALGHAAFMRYLRAKYGELYDL